MSKDWKDIRINGIASIEKCVAEFCIRELRITPYGKFKVKIYEKNNGKFIGYTNLQLKDIDGFPYPGVGHGDDIESALEDTVRYFLKILSDKKNISEDDFVCTDKYDF